MLRVTIALESVARESPKLLPRAIAHFVNFIEGSSATDCVTDVTDVTDVKDRRKKEEGRGEREKARIKKDLVISPTSPIVGKI